MAGPTQNYDDPSLVHRPPHPVAAAAVRAALVAGPGVLALAAGTAAAVWLGPDVLGVPVWLWVVCQVVVTTLLLLGLAALARRLMPLSTLLRLSLYVPDQAPSRLAVVLRRHSPAALRHRLAEADAAVGDPSAAHADLLLELVAALHAHDEGTRTHSERVQAYSLLVARELGLPPHEAAALSWAALLHDIGKLEIPVEVLTKPGRPDAQEWAALTRHPEHGARLVAPLQPWLGGWAAVVAEHHERWDGRGYPAGLAADRISLGARIVAVADAYDAITSARSYKKPLSAGAARAELARCAGTQFDPDVVRAFLAVGLGRLRLVAGPLSLLSALPGLPPMPRIAALAATAVPPATATVAAVVAGLAVLAPWTPSGAEALEPVDGSGAARVEVPRQARPDPGPAATDAVADPALAQPSAVPPHLSTVDEPATAPATAGPAPQPPTSAPGGDVTTAPEAAGQDPAAGTPAAPDAPEPDAPEPDAPEPDAPEPPEPSGTEPPTDDKPPWAGVPGQGAVDPGARSRRPTGE